MSDEVAPVAADYWDFLLRTSPTWAHMLGDYRYAGTYEDVSRAAEDAQIAAARAFAWRAESIAPAGLGAQARITRDMLIFDATSTADLAECRLAEITVDPIHGPQATLPLQVGKLSIPSAEVAAAMLDKFRGIARMFRDLGERAREGVARKRTPPRFAVLATLAQLDGWLARPLDDDPLLAAVRPRDIDVAADWQAQLRGVVERDVRPAMARYRRILHDEILPAARSDEQCGLAWLPDGEQAYARAIRLYTTLDLSPQEIHDIGRREVGRLAEEYRQLGAAILGTADLGRIFERLRSDPALRHTSGVEIVAAAAAALRKARAAMGDWFGTLPRADCQVEETTSGAMAFYFQPAQDGSRGGVFFMNTADPGAWGRFEIESTAYHEGIPGHHLQIAIAGELSDLPEFRKHAWVTAYGEGWGLYAERLADEMGLYGTPLDRLGMLSNDSLRACRLVVDTGLHALGWTRAQAVAYMVANSPIDGGHVRAEVDRYICSPGQALAYMLGRLEIQRLRAEAEARLGERFDIRSFHDTVLTSGPMPLRTLARVVSEWSASLPTNPPDATRARLVTAHRAVPRHEGPRRVRYPDCQAPDRRRVRGARCSSGLSWRWTAATMRGRLC